MLFLLIAAVINSCEANFLNETTPQLGVGIERAHCRGMVDSWELCDNIPDPPYGCCPKDHPVCCLPTRFWPMGYCCPVNYTCGGGISPQMCYNVNPNDPTLTPVPGQQPTPTSPKPTSTTPKPTPTTANTTRPTANTTRPTETTTAVTLRNQCVPFKTGGCPSTQDDDGFLGIVDSTDSSSCEHICRTYINGECRSIIFQPFDLENPSGEGICEMWRYTAEEYHGLCTWNSGPKTGDPQCLSLNYHGYSPCEEERDFSHPSISPLMFFQFI